MKKKAPITRLQPSSIGPPVAKPQAKATAAAETHHIRSTPPPPMGGFKLRNAKPHRIGKR